MTNDHTFDYSHITDQIIVGSDLCRGAVCPIHSEDFKRLGVCAELNLMAEKKETPPDDLDAYLWIPVVDKTAPTPDQLNLGTSFINEAVENGKTVYVHCHLGHGRSPTMVAAYFIRYKKMSPDEAIEAVRSRRSEVHLEDSQVEALKKYSKKFIK